MDQTLLTIILVIVGLVGGGIAGAIWQLRRPDPNPKGRSKQETVQPTQPGK